jgi:hypothetical protein
VRAALVLLAAAIVLASATAGLASPQFTSSFELAYVPSSAGASAGIDTLMRWSDPGEPGGKPRRVTKIMLLFERGTRIDTSAVSLCRASDAAVLRQGEGACPRASKIGSGTSKLTPGSGPVAQTQISFFNAPKQIIVLVSVSGRTLAVYRDDIKGRAVTVNLALPSSLSLLELHATINPRKRRHVRKGRIYFRNPRTCPPSGQWLTTVVWTYADGSTQQLSDAAPCRARSAPLKSAARG